MGRRTRFVTVCLFLLVAVGAVTDPLNKSNTGGLHWATAKEEGDLLKEAEESAAIGDDNNEFDGGFSSFSSMLHWAIGHSDPAKLTEAAQDVQRLSADDLKKRQLEIKELTEQLKMPSDAQLMQIALADLNNSSLSVEDHRHALQELLILVEMIDNANDLNKLGGLDVVIRELNSSDQEIRLTSAWILGQASQNNPVVQKQILEHGAMTKLIEMVSSSSVEEATKGLYAVSALIRNNVDGQQLFYMEGGDLMLQDIMRNSSVDIKLRKKSAFLVADLAECQLENTDRAAPPLFSSRFFLKSVVDLTASSDLDLQEKALMAIKSLLQLKTTEALDFKDFCGLDGVLERMREQLQQLMEVEYQRDFAKDMENLLREVELIFRSKLEKEMWIPT